MAVAQSALLDLLDALNPSAGLDVIRSTVEVKLQQLIEEETATQISAEGHACAHARTV